MRADTQLRLAPSGAVLGFDQAALITIAEALGYSKHAFVGLVGSAEVGMVQGVKKRYGDS